MREAVLISDTHPLTRVNRGDQEGQMDERFAVNCNADVFLSEARETLTDEATDLLRHSLAPATERALRGDLAHFQDWGGSLPATSATVCVFIGDHAGHHAVATIHRRVASFSKAHEMAGLPNPCRAEIVKATLRGLRRKHGTAQRQAKPLMRDDLLLVLDSLGETQGRADLLADGVWSPLLGGWLWKLDAGPVRRGGAFQLFIAWSAQGLCPASGRGGLHPSPNQGDHRPQDRRRSASLYGESRSSSARSQRVRETARHRQ